MTMLVLLGVVAMEKWEKPKQRFSHFSQTAVPEIEPGQCQWDQRGFKVCGL
jgi:hypothetical protein